MLLIVLMRPTDLVYCLTYVYPTSELAQRTVGITVGGAS